MRPSLLVCRVSLVAGLLVLLGGPLTAAAPHDELLRFVPGDVGFCAVVRDLRGHVAALRAAPFAGQLLRSPLWASLVGAREVGQLEKIDRHLRRHIGLGWDRLRDDILGEAVVLAYRPGPPDQPEREQGLILVRARDARALAELVSRLNEVQKASGQLVELEERTYHGVRYQRRAERRETNYYLLRGPVLVFSAQEEMLRRAIDQDHTLAEEAEPPVARRLRELGVGRCLLALWINPRAFDAAIEARAAAAGSAAVGLKVFATYWKALEGAALSLSLETDLAVSLAVRARTEELPAPARRYLATAAGPSAVWRSFPEQPLLAAGGRVDAAALFDLLGAFMPAEGRATLAAELNRTLGAALGKDVVKEVLPALGPDWGVCLTAPPAEEKEWFPHGVFALRVQPGEPFPPVDRSLLSALHSWAVFAVLAHNGKRPDHPLTLKTGRQEGGEVHYLAGVGVFPPGVQPAFALQSGYLLLATSPEALRRLAPAAAPAAPPASGPVPLLRVSFKSWRAYLAQHRPAVVGALARKHGLTHEEAEHRLDRLLAGLQLVDRLELRQQASPHQLTLTLSVQTARPLR